MRKILLTLFITFTASSCGETIYDAPMQVGDSISVARSSNSSSYLAYEHWLGISVEEDDLAEKYESVVAACSVDRDNECTILDAQISSVEEASASVRLRVLPAGVDKLVEVASQGVKVIERRTHVEDLEKVITDVNARVSMLTATRDKLINIESRAVDDVDSLIKVASELSRVQAELEQLSGQNASNRQRVEKQMLTVHFLTSESTSFFAPVTIAFSQFGRNLSEGIGDTVTAIAYLLPWTIVLFFVVLAVRKIWRWGRRK